MNAAPTRRLSDATTAIRAESLNNSASASLQLYGPGSVDRLDPASAQPPHMRQVMRLLTRQLLSHQPRQNPHDWHAVAAVADMAVDIPSTYNAGLGASHRSYIVHLRPDVMWDTDPPRAVTAHDFVRGMKRMCCPWSRAPGLTYFTSTVRGMAEYCDGFTAAVPSLNPRPQHFADFQNTNEIPGVFALDEATLVIELVRPSPDFIDMLTMPCASAAPVEYDDYLPGSPELSRNVISNGPYRVARLVPDKRLRLEHNPVWQQDTDPLRQRRLPAIDIEVQSSPPRQIRQAIAVGTVDLPWGPTTGGWMVAPISEPDRQASWALDPYIVFNFTTGSPALRDPQVRRHRQNRAGPYLSPLCPRHRRRGGLRRGPAQQRWPPRRRFRRPLALQPECRCP
jgi:peptide/nickel transport system substrate-binding protein